VKPYEEEEINGTATAEEAILDKLDVREGSNRIKRMKKQAAFQLAVINRG